MYPHAHIPVVQLSIDITKPLFFHYELGKALSFLREEGVLIFGSGNIVHNLSMIQFGEHTTPYQWAVDFDDYVQKCIAEHTYESLMNIEGRAHASFAVPTADHYIPLLYVLGAGSSADALSFPTTGFDLGSISMRSVLLS
jgi:4,5-DOPA dioxygenase extradiol